MSESSSHLSQELAEMSDRFSDLGERLLTAARHLHAPGTPPPDDLLESLTACRDGFRSLRGRACELAGSLFVTCPPAEQVTSLQDLTGLLDQVAEAEIRQSKSEEQRRRSLSVLDRVLALSHTSNADFAPLRECQDKARELRYGIAEGNWTTLPAEAERLAEGQHHFADLLTLISDHDDLHDEHWATLHESVGQNFGKALAAAAARSKLVLPQTAESRRTGAPATRDQVGALAYRFFQSLIARHGRRVRCVERTPPDQPPFCKGEQGGAGLCAVRLPFARGGRHRGLLANPRSHAQASRSPLHR